MNNKSLLYTVSSLAFLAVFTSCSTTVKQSSVKNDFTKTTVDGKAIQSTNKQSATSTQRAGYSIKPSQPDARYGLGNNYPTYTGKASYYGKRFHGRTTASGEPFNMHRLTAAHKELSFGTKVRVTNLENGRTVVVTINDRGPYAKKRIIDLSKAAAKKIGMIRAGVVDVKVEILN